MNLLYKKSISPFAIALCVFTAIHFSHADSPDEKREAALVHYQRGRDHADKGGQFGLAIEEFEKAIQLDPTIAEVYCELGAAYRGKGMQDEAEKYYEKSLTLESSHHTRGVACLCLGMIYMGHRGEFARAEEFCKEAASLLPDMAAAHFWLAEVYGKRGKLDLATNEYKRAIELDPDSAGSYKGMGLVYTKHGKIEDAIKYYREAIERDKYDPDSYYNIALCYLRLRKKVKGQQLMETYKRMKAYQDKIKEYSEAYGKDPGNLKLRVESAQLHAKHGNFKAVSKEYERIIYIVPDFALAYNNLGLACLQIDDFDRAERAFRKTLELNPEAATAYLGLGQLYDRQEKFDLAEKQYQKAIQLAPTYEVAYASLAEIYLRRQNPDSAISTYAKYAKTQPKSPRTWLRLGVIQINGKRHDDAIESFKRAIELDTDYAEAHNNLAWVYAENGRNLDEALTLAKRAVELVPTASNLDTLAYVYYRKESYQEAEREILRALEREPEDTGYQNRLQEVRRAREEQFPHEKVLKP